MTTVHPGGPAVLGLKGLQSAHGLERVLRGFSVLIMLMTVPQVVTVWTGPAVSGVSLVTWLSYLVSAFLWLYYGIRKRDIYAYYTEIAPVLIHARLDEFKYSEATALAVVLLVASFVLLIIINGLQRWSKMHAN